MARLAENRNLREPVTDEQRDRCDRILAAAQRQASQRPFDEVQMQEIASEAGVSIATVYRYFPSKTALFTRLMSVMVERMSVSRPADPPTDVDPVAAIGDLLVEVTHALAKHPQLTYAMLASNQDRMLRQGPYGVTEDFRNLLLAAGGLDPDSPHHVRLVRMTMQIWHGIAISLINGVVEAREAEADIRLAVELLLAGLDDR